MIARFKYAWRYFLIAWRNDDDITGKMLRQLKDDGNITAHTMEFLHRKYTNAAHIEMGYSPIKKTYTIKMQMED